MKTMKITKTMTATTRNTATNKTAKLSKALLAQAGALLLGAGVLAGCSSGSSTTPVSTSNTVTGKTAQAAATSTSLISVPPTGGTTQTIAVNGQQVTAVVPSGSASVGAGAPLAVVMSGSAPLSGVYPSGAAIAVNGVSNSGLTIDATGAIVQNAALPVDPVQGTDYTIALPQSSLQTRALTIQTTNFSGRFYVRNGVLVSPFPTNITGKIPNNGENAVGSKVTATFGAGNDGRAAHLTINYGNGFVLDQTQFIASSQVTFQNFSTDASNIPANGVASLTFAVGK